MKVRIAIELAPGEEVPDVTVDVHRRELTIEELIEQPETDEQRAAAWAGSTEGLARLREALPRRCADELCTKGPDGGPGLITRPNQVWCTRTCADRARRRRQRQDGS